VQEALFDPCFFKETINCEGYVRVILGHFLSELTEEESVCGWFQHDSAPAHTACTDMSMQALSDVFGNRTISSDIWPARSPNLILVIFSSGVA
jgi:hypothetical protein